MATWKRYLAAAVGAVALGLGGSAFADVKIQGTGATFPAPLYAKWIEAYGKAHSGVIIDYQAQGSGAGITAITQKTVQFGASDAPLTKDQEKAADNKLVHLPTVAGPAVMIYNVPGVDKLTLDGATISGIYLNQIKTWNDPKIAAINKDAKLPNSPIVVVHRSDGSGTSFIFTDYLSAVNNDWDEKVGHATTVQWPVGVGGKGNDGVASAVAATPGGVGYVELAYANKNKLAFATLQNKAGKPVMASVDAVNAAASNIKNWPADLKVSIVDANGEGSYPICGFTYLLVYSDLSSCANKADAQEVVDFIKWCETDGQAMAGDLGYAMLPKEAQSKVLDKLKGLTYKGEALK